MNHRATHWKFAAAILRAGCLAIALGACQLAVGQQTLDEVHCEAQGAIGPPACSEHQICINGICTRCGAEELCGDKVDNDCRNGPDDGCQAQAGGGGAGGVLPDGSAGTKLDGGIAGQSGSAGAGGSDAGPTGGTAGSAGSSCTGECTAGWPDEQACGNCGKQTRTCDSQCKWGPWGACSGEGICASGTAETAGACGNCGTNTRTCEGCQWGGYACMNQGECTPGQVELGWKLGCGVTGAAFRRCAETNCMWGALECIDSGCKSAGAGCAHDHECCSGNCGGGQCH
ncbi:MAG: hypothetical protein HY898_09680 [Deltaproteobacteria bacterium]|nr:hypothetical protein [Deltaproteobacteria bacterium]